MRHKSHLNSTTPSAFNFQKSPSHSKSKPDKSTTECNYCHKKGHWAQECQKHLSNTERQRNANVATQKGKNDLSSIFSGTKLQFRDAWIANSGADHHIVCDCNSFIEYTSLSGQFLNGVGGIKAPIHGCGTIAIMMKSHTGSHSVELRDCYHIPTTDGNLLSLCRFDRAGGQIQIKSGKIVLVTVDGIELCQGQAQGDSLYMMDMQVNSAPAAMAGTTGGDSDGRTWEEWHKAMGHISPQTLKSMRDSGMVQGMKVIPSPLDFDCDACIQGKQSAQPLPKESHTEYTEIGELIVTDVWGPAQITGRGGFRYYISFTNAAS